MEQEELWLIEMIGHNPNAARQITKKIAAAGLAVVDFDAGSWSDAQEGRLVDYQSPKTLP